MTKRTTGYYSTYKKLAVQWLNLPAGRQVKLCVAHMRDFVMADSFRLRNCQLLIAANRCTQFNNTTKCNSNIFT
jgi:hypothetical protein